MFLNHSSNLNDMKAISIAVFSDISVRGSLVLALSKQITNHAHMHVARQRSKIATLLDPQSITIQQYALVTV